MTRGICVNCGRPVGRMFQPPGYHCPGCGKVFVQPAPRNLDHGAEDWSVRPVGRELKH